MFAGKTEEFIRRIIRLQYANQKVLIFKPSIDTRYDATKVVTHKGVAVQAQVIDRNNPQIILDFLNKSENKNIVAVAVDEIQFFDKKIIDIINYLANKGKKIIVAGLDQDFRGEPFPIVSELLARSEFVTKLDAVCVKCGAAATRTQRIINGKPARYDDPIIKIGAQESYEARCRKDHEVIK